MHSISISTRPETNRNPNRRPDQRQPSGRPSFIAGPGHIGRSERKLSTPRREIKQGTMCHLAHGFQSGWFNREEDNSVLLADTLERYEPGFPFREEEAAPSSKGIDCYVLVPARITALELGWPYGDPPAIVVTGRKICRRRVRRRVYSCDLKTFVDVQLGPRYRNICSWAGPCFVPAFSRTRPGGRNQG